MPTSWEPHWETILRDCPTALAWGPGDDHLAVASLAGDVVRIEVAAGVPERVADHAGGALCVAWAGSASVQAATCWRRRRSR